jgi:pimeloyl-ACP methyl ester carboxylesterase
MPTFSRIFAGFAALYLMVSVLVMPAGAQSDPLTLVPFEDPAYRIAGVVPETWTALGQGLYSPQAGSTTLLAQQAAPAAPDTIMPVLMRQLRQSSAPAPVDTIQTEALRWTVYQIDVTVGSLTVRVDLALAESNAVTYILLLQTVPEEYDALHEQVFLPALQALRPVVEVFERPYRFEEVTFSNGDITLAGTLSLPAGEAPYAAVVLMSGSGPQDRNEEVVPGFRIFEQLADYLTPAGIAVLRYDDRGVGQSGGSFDTASMADFASDALAAVAYLRGRSDINPEQIGLLGHSEGGVYAAIIGATPDSGVSFIITLAGPGVRGTELLSEQNRLILATAGATDEQIEAQLAFLEQAYPLILARNWDAMEALVYQNTLEDLAALPADQREGLSEADFEAYAADAAASFRLQYGAEWFASLLEYDPAPDFAQTTQPVLAIFGGKDVQVSAVQNADPLRAALEAGGNTDVTVVTLPDANHLFQSAVTGGLDEYTLLKLELMPELLELLSDWLGQRVTLKP